MLKNNNNNNFINVLKAKLKILKPTLLMILFTVTTKSKFAVKGHIFHWPHLFYKADNMLQTSKFDFSSKIN